jgi:protein O-GlcNAc transferase
MVTNPAKTRFAQQFARAQTLQQHLARYRAADLFLDTLPYNAGTTASDALWAGLAVLTLTAEAFANRIALAPDHIRL